MFWADLSFLTLVQDFYLVFTLFSYYLFTYFLLITSGFALIISLYVIYFSFYFLILYYLSSALSLPLLYFNIANSVPKAQGRGCKQQEAHWNLKCLFPPPPTSVCPYLPVSQDKVLSLYPLYRGCLHILLLGCQGSI